MIKNKIMSLVNASDTAVDIDLVVQASQIIPKPNANISQISR